jgi:hypothetical protein
MKKIRVGMNEADISTEETPIIGTDALGPCVGVLIYSPKHQKSVVIHASTEWKEAVVQALILLAENEIISFENLNKSIESLYLHDKYSLYEFDSKTKSAILEKQGLKISSVKPEDKIIVTIIPGYYQDNYDVAVNITKFFMSLNPLTILNKGPLPKKAVRTVMFEDLGSHEFYFNSKTGKFITEKIKDQTDSKGYRL